MDKETKGEVWGCKVMQETDIKCKPDWYMDREEGITLSHLQLGSALILEVARR